MRWIVMLIVVLSLVAPVAAHNPRVEVGDWGNFDAPYVIEDGRVSFALFGGLDDEADIDVFRLEFTSAQERLRLRLFVPVCGERLAEYFPQVLLLQPAAPDQDPLQRLDELLSETPPDDLQALTQAPSRDEDLQARLGDLPTDVTYLAMYRQDPAEAGERPTEYESHTRRTYYRSETIDYSVEQAGSYYLVVFSPQGGGEYLLSLGILETFFAPLESEPDDVSMDYRAGWPLDDCR